MVMKAISTFYGCCKIRHVQYSNFAHLHQNVAAKIDVHHRSTKSVVSTPTARYKEALMETAKVCGVATRNVRSTNNSFLASPRVCRYTTDAVSHSLASFSKPTRLGIRIIRKRKYDATKVSSFNLCAKRLGHSWKDEPSCLQSTIVSSCLFSNTHGVRMLVMELLDKPAVQSLCTRLRPI